MIKQITNLNGIKIETNRIVDGSSIKYVNQATNELKTGTSMLYKFHNVSFNNIERIGNATLLIPVVGNGTFEIGVFRNTSTYVTSLVHGNNEPTYDASTNIHYEKFTIGKSGGALESRLIEVDLTTLFNRWLSESATNLSITFKCTSTATLTIFGPNHEDFSNISLLDIRYAMLDSFSNSFDYISEHLNFGGTSFVNTLTGKLAHQFDVFQTESKKFPIKFSVNYIDPLTGVNMQNSLIGNWRTNFDYRFEIGSNKITIISPVGSVAFYEKITREDAAKIGIVAGQKEYCFVNYSDNSYILEDGRTGNVQNYKMFDTSENIYDFNSKNLLLKITKVDGEYIKFTHNSSNQVSSILSKDGYQVTITYMNNKIQYVNFIKENKRIVIFYSTEGLSELRLQNVSTEVTYSGTVSSYSEVIKTTFKHDGNRLIQIVNNKTLEGLKFEYNNNKIVRIINTIKDGTNNLNGAYKQLNYYQKYTKVSDNEDNDIYLTHDSFGMLHQTIDKDGNSLSLKHNFVGVNGITRRVSDNSGVIPSSKNKLLDGSFELLEIENINSSLVGWKTDNINSLRQVQDGVYGKNALLINKTSEESSKVHQTVFIENGRYTLEFFIKTKNMEGKALVTATTSYKTSTLGTPSLPTIKEQGKEYKSIEITSAHSKWTKVTIENIYLDDINSNGMIKIMINASHTSGELLIDSMKFTNEVKISNNNLIFGGDLEESLLHKFEKINCDPMDKIISKNEQLPYSLILGKKHFRFSSAKDEYKSIERNLNLRGSSGESITFAFWAKSTFSTSSNLIGKILLYKGKEIIQIVEMSALRETSDWQLLSVSLNTNRTYDSVKLVIEYKGINECFIDNISVFRDDFGTHYNYNEKGNLIEESDRVTNTTYKTNENRLIESNDESGESYRYEYNDGKISQITDNKGNKIEVKYDRGNRTNTIISSNGKNIDIKSKYNSDDLLISNFDELENVTKFTYDSAKRLKTKTDANGTITTNSYDDFNNLISLVKTNSRKSISSSYEYNSNNTLKKITTDNGTTYDFSYDSFGRVLKIKLNSRDFIEYVYGIQKNGVTTSKVSKQIIGNEELDYLYDTKLRLIEIKSLGKSLIKYDYDSDSRITKKYNNENSVYYDYDNNGNLIRETRSNGDSFSFNYDNLEQLQKFNIDLNDMQQSYDYEYEYEYNESGKENLLSRIDKAFNDDIIDYNALNSGIYGARVDSSWGGKVNYNGKNLFRLNKKTSKIIYSLDTVNKDRKTSTFGGIFNLKEWQQKFVNSKTIFGLFRFTGDVKQGHKIFSFGDQMRDHYFVTLTKRNNMFDFKLHSIDQESKVISINATDEPIFIGLRIFRGDTLNETKFIFSINGKSESAKLYSSDYVSLSTKFVIGDRNILTGSMDNNPFLQDVSMISIGSYQYTEQHFDSIYKQVTVGEKKDIKSKTGISILNQNTYKNFEVMTLNGTLVSSKNRLPSVYEYVDDTYKIDKTKLFKYDTEIQRHVYGSYSEYQGFGIAKSLLIYNHDLEEKGTIAVNFKLEDVRDNNQVIFSFSNENNNKLSIYVNRTGKLELNINERKIETEHSVHKNSWNRLLVTYNNTKSKLGIYINNYVKIIECEVDLKNSALIIGSNLSGNNSVEHLEGALEMLSLNDKDMFDNDLQINKILNEGQVVTIKTELDAVGRSYKDIIDTGINRLEKEYIYKEPGEGLTSLQISKVRSFENTKEYIYDEMRNITKVITTNNETNINRVETYVYDMFSRLIEEYNSSDNKCIKYTYLENNNLDEVIYLDHNSKVTLRSEKYIYDIKYKDLLVNIIVTEADSQENNSILYDTNNTMLNYKGRKLKWQGNKLKEIEGLGTEYQYNDMGIRTHKKVNGELTSYHLHGEDIISITSGSNKMFFHYNERNVLVGLEMDGEYYFYNKDVLGIINSIVDIKGQPVVKYEYDSWGNWLNKDNAALTLIGEKLVRLNPFLYKDYIYDTESELYYLKNRYYSPELRRFISLDSAIGAISNIENYNLFAYCANNPVMNADSEGTTPKWLSAIGSAIENFAEGVGTLLKWSVKSLPELSMSEAKRIARKGGHVQSARSIIRGREQNISETIGMSNTFKNIAKWTGRAMLAIDIGTSIFNNFTSDSDSKVTDSIVDIAISGGIYALGAIPVVGWALSISAAVGINYLEQNTSVISDVKTWAKNTGDDIAKGWNKFWSFNWA